MGVEPGHHGDQCSLYASSISDMPARRSCRRSTGFRAAVSCIRHRKKLTDVGRLASSGEEQPCLDEDKFLIVDSLHRDARTSCDVAYGWIGGQTVVPDAGQGAHGVNRATVIAQHRAGHAGIAQAKPLDIILRGNNAIRINRLASREFGDARGLPRRDDDRLLASVRTTVLARRQRCDFAGHFARNLHQPERAAIKRLRLLHQLRRLIHQGAEAASVFGFQPIGFFLRIGVERRECGRHESNCSAGTSWRSPLKRPSHGALCRTPGIDRSSW